MIKVFNIDGTATTEIRLPKVFSYDYRPDLIQRAVLAIQSHKRQPYGPNILAGKRTSAHYHGSRHKRYTMMNRELARLPRSHNTSPRQEMRARRAPQTVSGRKAHPPKVEKIWDLKINKKEKIAAIKSAIAATAIFDLVNKRHKIPEIDLPIIIKDDIQKIKKTKELKNIINALKLSDDLKRASIRKIRPGKGKMRGRKYKKKKSFLMVIEKDDGIVKACKNLSGVDVCNVKNINAELLAPGTQAGRLTIWSESAIKKLGEIYG